MWGKKFTVSEVTVLENNEINLSLLDKDDTTKKYDCILCDTWNFHRIKIEDEINLFDPIREENDRILKINDNQGFLILFPDIILSTTTILSSLTCPRKAILSQKYAKLKKQNIPMFIGNFIHKLFQTNVTDDSIDLKEIIENLSRFYVQEMKTLDITRTFLNEQISYYLKGISEWRDLLPPQYKDVSVSDIEECYYSKGYGLKGRIDLTLSLDNKTIPLELKSGRARYSKEHECQMLLYNILMDVKGSLLLYLRDKPKLKIISKFHGFERQLFQLRNLLAYHLKQETLPDPIDDARICRFCDFKFACSLNLERSQMLTNGVKSFAPEAIKHLTDDHISYYRYWLEFFRLESKQKKIKSSSIVFLKEIQGDDIYVFESDNLHDFKKGEMITVKSEMRFYWGVIEEVVTKSDETFLLKISIIVDKKNKRLDKNSKYTLENYDYNDLSSVNLVKLLEPDNANLRKIIIDRIKMPILTSQTRYRGEVPERLNHEQKEAVRFCVHSNILLVKGSPGSGKTEIIVHLIDLLVKNGKTVLLTSFTNSALDNVLTRLSKLRSDFFRVDNKMHRDRNPIKKCYSDENHPVVASTCLGINNAVIQNRMFDACIVDEASQILEPTVIGPLLRAKTWFLFGDEKQLKPVVLSGEARRKGMDRSLFEKLSNNGTIIELNNQYRMNSKICTLVSNFLYNGRLRCGNRKIAEATLNIPETTLSTWYDYLTSPLLKHSVVFVNRSFDQPDNRFSNKWESDLIHFILELFAANKINVEDIGVITPYSKQVELIKQRNIETPSLSVNTVDKFQGQEKDVIIFSSVIGNFNHTPADDEILQCSNRINTTISRARKKLILVGCKRILERYPTFERLFGLIDVIVDVPEHFSRMK